MAFRDPGSTPGLTQNSDLPRIGVLCLDEAVPRELPRGTLVDPSLFKGPVTARKVPGASLEAVLDHPEQVADRYLEIALETIADGANTIVSNCGYTIVMQDDLAKRCNAEVVTSSLCSLPGLLSGTRDGLSIAVLCFDANRLTNSHLESAEVDPRDERIGLFGLEGSETWRKALQPAGYYDWSQMAKDLSVTCRAISARRERFASLLIECCAFLPFADDIARATGLPTLDLRDTIEAAASDAIRRAVDHGQPSEPFGRLEMTNESAFGRPLLPAPPPA